MPSTITKHARVQKNFVPWMKVQLESHGIAVRYESALEKKNIKLRGNAPLFLSASLPQGMIANVVRTTPKELGFESAATYREICGRALELGLQHCRPETVFALRLLYTKQPIGEVVRMCTETYRTPSNQWEIPTLEERREHTIIGGWRAHPDDRYEPHYLLAFELG